MVGAAGLTVAVVAGSAFARNEEPSKKLKILFLGGTGFLGPHTVEILKEHGHEITLFNRGNRDELFPDLEFIQGNRIVDVDPGLEPLRAEVEKGRKWDAVIDTASVHRWVENSARLLKDAASQYVFISSVSAYASTPPDGNRETDPVATMPDEEADKIDRLPYDMNYYGAVKARSEAAAEKYFPGKAAVLRPGLIVGPRDYSHRFTYWPWRVREGGEVLAPNSPTDPIMFVDVRDVAAFLVRTIEQRTMGLFNVSGPTTHDMTIGKLLDACKQTTFSKANFTWVDADFLENHDIHGWVQMPVWLPPTGETEGFHKTHLDRAIAAGLTTRPVTETIRDTLAWFDKWRNEAKDTRGYEYKPGENAPGVSSEQEAKVLAEWKSREG
ncbi:MAG: NAD-dependent epimerase/dehydratase family protein [Phycisphaeraceae bacterium]|nr:MAG: NAD-dependent epimerase/dehydratase family protein [Phycisphaeraceae bacterium]